MSTFKRKVSERGLTLVEVLVAAAIVLVFLVAVFVVNNTFIKSSSLNTEAVKAAFLAEEGLEAVRFLRDSSWSTNVATLFLGTNYYLNFSTNTWVATTVPSVIDGEFTRIINISGVNRDANSDIASSGGTLDPNTKLVTATVSWQTGSTTASKVISTYITNLFGN